MNGYVDINCKSKNLSLCILNVMNVVFKNLYPGKTFLPPEQLGNNFFSGNVNHVADFPAMMLWFKSVPQSVYGCAQILIPWAFRLLDSKVDKADSSIFHRIP